MVRLGEQAIGKALDQRQRDQHHGGVESPFAQVFGGVAPAAQHGFDAAGFGRLPAARGPGQPTPADRPLGALGPQPVHGAGNERAHAQPLVQAVHLVQPAQLRLQPHRPHRQHHGQRHHAHDQHPAVLHPHGAKREVAGLRGPQRVGQQPQAAQGGQKAPEHPDHSFHLDSLRLGISWSIRMQSDALTSVCKPEAKARGKGPWV